jgi:gamma-glutamyltranspeptidase / glutathione hydrolase
MKLPALVLVLLLSGCALPLAQAPRHAGVVATANPLATQAALAMLARGGTAADAALAAQLVLGLIEPQSSGLGGGALAMVWDASTKQLSSFDGLAAAPARVTAGLTLDADGSRLDAEAVRRGGRSVGVPGALVLMETLHQRHGRLPWATLFEPAIALAEGGFAMPRYLHDVLAAPGAARDHPSLRDLYFDTQDRVLPIGTLLRNPAYAHTLRRIATLGAQGWLREGGAREFVAAAQGGAKPSFIVEADLLAYRVQERAPLCAPFQRYRVCAMGPSSFGGVVVLQMLPMLERAPTSFNFDDAEFVHRYAEAGRLAQADRQRYVGDPGYVNVPTAALLAPDYLARRATLIDASRAMPEARAGALGSNVSHGLSDTTEHATTTSQVAVVDASGNALAITTTINLNFGSRLTAGGYVLNNAMTNFSDAPPPGQQRANQMAPGKRPVSSMAPTIVFDADGAPVVVGGSAGGGQIVDYIAQSLLEMLVHERTPAQALARGHVSTAVGGVVQLERGTPQAALADALRAKGHRVEVVDMKSGLAFVKRTPQGWTGAADPRRDGAAAAP